MIFDKAIEKLHVVGPIDNFPGFVSIHSEHGKDTPLFRVYKRLRNFCYSSDWSPTVLSIANSLICSGFINKNELLWLPFSHSHSPFSLIPLQSTSLKLKLSFHSILGDILFSRYFSPFEGARDCRKTYSNIVLIIDESLHLLTVCKGYFLKKFK